MGTGKFTGFEIGDRVEVSATVDFTYDENRNREVIRTELDEPMTVIVTGGCYRRLGKLDPGGEFGGYMDPPDYQPPCLVVSGTIPVLNCKKTFIGKPFDVLLEDAKKTD